MDVGFLINPVAGMGGTVGLKGTDGVYEEAVRRGAHPTAAARAKISLSLLKDAGLELLTCSGEMGENAIREAGIVSYRVVYHYDGESSALDTRNAVRSFIEQGAQLVVFCGGDGTARDVQNVVGRDFPMLGIPAGVKMYSAVFAIDPAAAADIIRQFPEVKYRHAEVVDLDEHAYRKGDLNTKIFGYARIPYIPNKTQLMKGIFEEQDEDRAKEEIAVFIGEIMNDDTLYILGAGTTTESIAKKMGIAKTMLGIDAIKGGTMVARDTDEQTLLALVSREPHVKIILSPLGAEGFILGRGTQQISPEVLKHVGIENIIVVATPYKLSQTPLLYVDTGDSALDAAFGTDMLVISGYRIAQRKRIYQSSAEERNSI